jgi:hypothetical protein
MLQFHQETVSRFISSEKQVPILIIYKLTTTLSADVMSVYLFFCNMSEYELIHTLDKASAIA